MSHYRPYPRLKPSGVPWLSDLPDHWQVAQLGKLSKARCDGPFGSGLKSDHYVPEGIRVVRLQNIGWAAFSGQDAAFISEKHWHDKLNGGHDVNPGDVLIAGLGDDNNPLGRACVAPDDIAPAMVKADCYRFRLRVERLNPDFAALALSATARAECGFLATGATRERLNLGLAASRKLPIPPLEEQAGIVTALSSETARIDALIEKKTRFIELLKEKRQALITQAVTKGLDPTVPVKDSGIEWIGEVPAHWVPIKFRYVARVTEGLVDPKSDHYRAMPLIAPNHIESNTGRIIGIQSAEEQNAESGKYTCKTGDVIYSKIRPALAKVAIAPADCLCSADMYPLNATFRTHSDWLFYLMLSRPFTAWATLESERVAMPKINRESLGELQLYLPPLAEQQRAASWLRRSLPRLDLLSQRTDRSINLLKERRSALITAAVTGQIDLREDAA